MTQVERKKLKRVSKQFREGFEKETREKFKIGYYHWANCMDWMIFNSLRPRRKQRKIRLAVPKH